MGEKKINPVRIARGLETKYSIYLIYVTLFLQKRLVLILLAVNLNKICNFPKILASFRQLY